MPVSGDRIVRLAARGEGVTEGGRFVPMTAPGDLVDAAGAITPGPNHAAPPCRHFPECGGCQLQHVDDEAYGVFLVDRIVSALAAQNIAAPDILAPHISPPVSRRRASLHAERKGGHVALGFHAQASHRIIDMRECFVLRPELFALVDPLRRLMRQLLSPRASGGVRMTLTDQGADILLEKVSADSLEATEALAAFAETYGLARLALDDGYGPQTRWEPEPVTVTLGATPTLLRHPGESRDPCTPTSGEKAQPVSPTSMFMGPGLRRDDGRGNGGVAVSLPHGAFLQATQEGEAALVAAMREAVGDARIVADLFAGLGTFALALDGRILAVEGARDAALALKAAAARAQRQVFVDHRDLFRNPLREAELNRFEAIILDPPRAGAKDQVDLLAKAEVPRIAYISCNPSTFARDAKALIEGGYRPDWIKPVGQFRWSTHVELAAAFKR